MKKGKKLNIRSYALDCMFFSSFSLLAIALSYILGPEFLTQTFAEEPAADPGTITMTVTPLDAAQQGNIRVHKPSSDGDFYTVGFGINVETANTYGYQLTMRSQRPNARLEYSDGDFADTVYIDPITEDLSVNIPSGSTFNEKNHYGWSTDWNPITQKGTFHGFDAVGSSGTGSNTTISPSNIVARSATLKRTLGPSATGGDKLDLYFGVNVSNTLLQGRYTGKIILTAISNSLSDVSTTYTLHYDSNATPGSVGASTMPDDPASFTVVEGGSMGTFTVSTAVPVRSGFTFLGWSRDKRATTAEFVGGNEFTPNEANTTLYAIWQQSFTIVLKNDDGSTFRTVTCDNTQSCVITLPLEEPTKSGYTFAYWLDTYYNRTYQPGDTITLTYDHPSLNLTPVFVPANTPLASGNPSPSGDGQKAGALGEDTLKDLPEDVLEVIRLIQLLPDADKVSLKDKDLVEQTRAAYDKLSDENKALISATLISKYNSVLAAYYSLANGEADNGNLIIAACAGAAVATIALTALLIVKKSDDDDDEEEEK